jgi:hypothetical protein
MLRPIVLPTSAGVWGLIFGVAAEAAWPYRVRSKFADINIFRLQALLPRHASEGA